MQTFQIIGNHGKSDNTFDSSLVNLNFKGVRTLAALFSMLASALSALHAQEISSVPKVPENANIRQESAGGQTTNTPKSISLRFVSEAERRGISQTFTWNVNSGLTGLGIKIADSGDWKRITSPQKYLLDVQEITDPLQERRVTATVASMPLAITPESVVPDQYLYIHFKSPLKLENGKSYGFHLRPADLVADNFLFVSLSGVTAENQGYAEGAGNQTMAETYNVGDRYGKGRANQEFDLLFYTTTDGTTPEPKK